MFLLYKLIIVTSLYIASFFFTVLSHQADYQEVTEILLKIAFNAFNKLFKYTIKLYSRIHGLRKIIIIAVTNIKCTIKWVCWWLWFRIYLW